MRFANDEAERLYRLTLDGTVDGGDGSVESPTGWFASLEDGGTFYLIREDSQGFVTVTPYEDVKERDAWYRRLVIANALYEAEITDEEATEALQAYQAAVLWTETSDMGNFFDLSFSEVAQETIRGQVMEFITSNVEHIRPFLEVTGLDWAQIGHDFWLTRNRHGAGFWDRGAAGPAVDALVESAHAYGEQSLVIGDDGVAEVL